MIKASIQGNMTSGLLWLGQINALCHEEEEQEEAITHHRSNNEIYPLELRSIKYLFYQNDQKRSPLYHAAHNGHHHLVEYYLSLYLIFSTKITFHSIHKNKTFRSWLFEVSHSNYKENDKNSNNSHVDHDFDATKQKSITRDGTKCDLTSYTSSFSPSDYDQCAIQSNDHNVQNVMIHKKVDVAYAMKVIDQASFSCVPYNALIQPRMKQIYFDVKSVLKKKRMHRERLNNHEEVTYNVNCCGDKDNLDDSTSSFSHSGEDFVLVENREELDKANEHQVKMIDLEEENMLIVEVVRTKKKNYVLPRVELVKDNDDDSCKSELVGLKYLTVSQCEVPDNKGHSRCLDNYTSSHNGNEQKNRRQRRQNNGEEFSTQSKNIIVRDGKRYILVKGLRKSTRRKKRSS